MKNTFFVFVCICLFGFTQNAHAGVIFTEIMYDVPGSDTDREWVEIYNDGTAEVDISLYKFVEENINHSLSAYQGGNTLKGGEYAIIADTPTKFLADTPGFKGMILDSSFSLSNEKGEQLSLKDSSGSVVDTILYNPTLGAAGDGATLQKNGSLWISAPATPGGTFSGGAGGSAGGSSGGSTSPISVPVSCVEINSRSYCINKGDTKKDEDIKRYALTILGQNSGYTHVPQKIPFTITQKNSTLLSEIIRVNYGDGTTEEIPLRSFLKKELSHIYEYEGDYTVTLEYFEDPYKTDPVLSDDITLSLKKPLLSIDFFDDTGVLEVKNDDTSVFDASGFIIKSGDISFTLPKNTKIQKKSRLLLSPRVTKFSSNSVRLPLEISAPDKTLFLKQESFLGEDPANLLEKTISQKDELEEPTELKKSSKKRVSSTQKKNIQNTKQKKK